MGSFSLSHWLLVLAIVLMVFGAGRVPKAMGDLARGVRAFRAGMREDHATEAGAGMAETADHKRVPSSAP
jgi:sec-independent protein translocase protein TatA